MKKRNELVTNYTWMTEVAASKAIAMYNLNKSILEDLCGEAMVDLIECANSFTITSASDFSGIEFKTYAWTAVMGGALDAAQKMSWQVTLTNSHKEKIDGGEYPNIIMQELNEEMMDENSICNEDNITSHQIMLKFLTDNDFSDKVKFAISQRFVLDRPQREIAKFLGCARRTVGDMQEKALKQLKAKLTD